MDKLKNSKFNRGITLVALVVTIVVLLILAGVSINLVLGENGLITQAKEAKSKTYEAKDSESKTMSEIEKYINDYVEIDWENTLASAKKHPEQKNSNTIGVGTDGKSVNMDLWEYTEKEDGTYLVVYKGNILENGNIESEIPQMIKEENSKFKEVTDLTNCFINYDKLNAKIKIPTTVKYMNGTFAYCTSLESMSEIPEGVIEMKSTFAGDTKLINLTKLPESLINMASTFYKCTSLENVPIIPKNVENLSFTFNACTSIKETPYFTDNITNLKGTFSGCTALKIVHTIPENVTNCYATFNGCTNLEGTIEVNANLTGKTVESNGALDYTLMFRNCASGDLKIKLIGSCTILDKIVEDAKNPNVTLELE